VLQVLVSFRGTQPTKIRDVIADINISQADVELEDEPELGAFEKWWNTTQFGRFRRAGIAV
jgi:hypothetical protein